MLAIALLGCAARADLQAADEPTPTNGFAFVPNRGQWPDEVRFRLARGAQTAWLVDGGYWIVLAGHPAGRREGAARASHGRSAGGWALRFDLVGSRSGAVVGERPLSQVSHWFLGAAPEQWAADVPSFARVRWPDVLPGVDLVARALDSLLRYDFELAPGVAPSALEWRVVGHTGLVLAADGALEVRTPIGTLRQAAPIAWNQLPDGGRRPVEARFVLRGGDRFGFDVLGHDARLPLVIDPALVWSTFLGGSIDQEVADLVVAPGGDVVVAGFVDSTDFPLTPGAFDTTLGGFRDAFVARLASDGKSLRWATFFGGTDFDTAKGVAVQPSGAVTICGDTQSSDLPVSAVSFGPQLAGNLDGFAARFSANGAQLLWSGYLGGTFADRANALDVLADGSALVAGSSNGGFPITSGALQTGYAGGQFAGDAFLARLRADGAGFVWSTYLGGSGDDAAAGVRAGSDGSATVVGQTSSTNFPRTPGAFDTSLGGVRDGFVTRLSANGASLVWSTFVGGPGDDSATSLSLATDSRVAVGGAAGPGFPTTSAAAQSAAPGQGDGWVGALAADGTQLDFGTYVGGSALDTVEAVRWVPDGSVVVAGKTHSDDLFVTPGAFDASYAGGLTSTSDAFVARVASDGSGFAYATYLGGLEDETVGGLVWVGSEQVIVAGRSGSADHPHTGGTLQGGYPAGAAGTGFVTRLALQQIPIEYGSGKASTLGHPPRMRWLGYPSLADANFQVGLDSALPGKPSVVFSGSDAAAIGWLGGQLLVRPPLARVAVLVNDFVGYAATPVPVDASLVGSTRYFQVWTQDPGDPFGAVMTPGLQVRFHP